MNKKEYNKIFPIGTVIIPNICCQNSFTMNTDLNDDIIQKCISKQLEELNNNKYKAKWVYGTKIKAILRVK